MVNGKREKDLLDFPYVFEVDRSWYQSYWMDPRQPAPARPGVHLAVWFAILCLGVYIGL